MNRFASKTVLVTGGAQGIGRGVVERMTSEGASAVILDIEGDTLAGAVAELAAGGASVEGVAGDVAQRADVHRAVETAVRRFGGLDVLVGVAGIAELAPFLDVTDASWDKILAVNLTGMYLAVQESSRVMASSGGGAIVLIASTNAFYPEAHTVPYSVSKAGIVGLVRATSLDLAEHGIRINAINPGQIATRLGAALVEDPVAGPAFLEKIPLRRWGTPADIAAVAAFLASDDAGYMTGEDVTVDAGMTIGTVIDIPDIAVDAPRAAPRTAGDHG